MVHIVIIGGGIGGLALAQLLKKQNKDDIQISIYERDCDKESRTQGYSIGITDESFNILREIDEDNQDLKGILDLSEKDSSLSDFVITNSKLEPRLSIQADTKLVSRWGLRNALTNNLDINWNKKFASYDENESEIKVHFTDGSSITCDILIGADGANSKIRKKRSPKLKREDLNIRNISGSIICPNDEELSKDFPNLKNIINKALIRVLGNNSYTMLIFAYHENNEKRILWSVSWSSNEELDADEEIREKLPKIMNENFNCNDVRKIINLTKPEDYIPAAKVLSAKPRKDNPYILLDSHGKRIHTFVSLLGDAAHPMTTHRGLGANTAMRDAKDLSIVLSKFPGRERKDNLVALERYEERLFHFGFKAIGESLQSTNMIHMNGASAGIRNSMLWIMSWFKSK